MVSPEKVPPPIAKLLMYFWMWRAHRNRTEMGFEKIDENEIRKREAQFRAFTRQNIHSREVEMSHLQFVRIYRHWEKMRQAERKREKWKKRASEPWRPFARTRRV